MFIISTYKSLPLEFESIFWSSNFPVCRG